MSYADKTPSKGAYTTEVHSNRIADGRWVADLIFLDQTQAGYVVGLKGPSGTRSTYTVAQEVIPSKWIDNPPELPIKVKAAIKRTEGYYFVGDGNKVAIESPKGERVSDYFNDVDEATEEFIARGYKPAGLQLVELQEV